MVEEVVEAETRTQLRTLPTSLKSLLHRLGMSMNQVIKAAQAFSDSKTAALKKSLDAERKDKEELKRLNQQLIGEVQQLQRQLKDAKDQHEEWRVKYSKALSEKIALLRPHEVSPAHPAMHFF
jgi:predicted nuclease with TOPRIM domain